MAQRLGECRKCGSGNPFTNKHCSECGEVLPWTSPHTAPASSMVNSWTIDYEAVKAFVSLGQGVSVGNLNLAFGTDDDTARMVLDRLMQEGVVSAPDQQGIYQVLSPTTIRKSQTSISTTKSPQISQPKVLPSPIGNTSSNHPSSLPTSANSSWSWKLAAVVGLIVFVAALNPFGGVSNSNSPSVVSPPSGGTPSTNGVENSVTSDDQLLNASTGDGGIAAYRNALAEMPEATRFFVNVSGDGSHRIRIVVTNEWHVLPYQHRLQLAQYLLKLWHVEHRNPQPETNKLTIRDISGNEVGGTTMWGRVWVQEY
jgi:hypothetical protein